MITGYHAAVAPSAIGRAFHVLLHVEMAVQDSATIEPGVARTNPSSP